jgi:hypothetical protein
MTDNHTASIIRAHRLGCAHARELSASLNSAEAKARATWPDSEEHRTAFIAGYRGTLRRMTRHNDSSDIV